MSLPARFDMQIGTPSIVSATTFPLIKRDGEKYFKYLGLVLVTETHVELWRCDPQPVLVSNLPRENNIIVRSFNDVFIPLFFISSGSSIGVYSTMDEIPRKLYSIQLPSLRDFLFTKDKFVVCLNDSTRIYNLSFDLYSRPIFGDYEEYYFTGSLKHVGNSIFSVYDGKETLFIYPTGFVKSLPNHVFYHSDDLTVTRQDKGIKVKKKGYKEISYTDESLMFFEMLDRTCIFGFPDELVLMDPLTNKNLVMEAENKNFISGDILISVGDTRILLYNLLSSAQISNFAPTLDNWKMNVIPKRPIISYNFERLLDIKLRTQKQMEWDNGQRPYYWPQVLFEDVD